MSLFAELKRRNVLRVAAAYIVTAWLVIQVVETIFPAFGFGDAAVRYVTIAFAIGLLPTLVVAWVFELTPEGLKKDADVDRERAFAVDSAKRLDRIILLVLALALGYFAFDKFVLDPTRDVAIAEVARQEGRSEAIIESFGEASIAVLAFENMSPDPEQAFFADGISEEILNLLAGIPELRVISRSSSFTYKGKEIPIPQIAKELKVAHVLEGSVRKAGNQVRVTAQLIDGHTDTHLWSRTWDRTLDDIFAIQDEVAADVVAELQLKLAGAVPTSRQTDSEAYLLVLQARQMLETPHDADREIVDRLVTRALEIDPDYVPALQTRQWQLLWLGQLPPEELDARWGELNERILDLEPENSVALSFRTWDLYADERALEAAASAFEVLVRRDPNNVELLRVAGGFLRRIGRFDAAIPLLKHCVMLDPLKHLCTWQLKETYLWAGNLEQARLHLDRLQVYWGQPPRVHDILLLLLEDKPEEARTQVEAWPQRDGFPSALLALAAYELAEFDAFERLKADYLDNPEVSPNPAWDALSKAQFHAYLDEHDEAFSWIAESANKDEGVIFQEILNPFFWNLHGDPRWAELRKRVGMDAERLDAIRFEVPPRFPAE
jgi:TolB-like protein